MTIILSTYSLNTLFCQEGVKPDIKSIENRFIKQRQLFEERKKNDSLRNALPTEFKNKLFPHLKKDGFVNSGVVENGRKSPKKEVIGKSTSLNNSANIASNELWVQKFNTKISAHDNLYDTFIDINNRIYITGESGGDIVTIKLNSSGDTAWSARYSGPAEYDEPCGVWVDGMGEVYVAGTSERDSLGVVQTDILLVKYNRYGKEQWVRRYKGLLRENLFATVLKYDDSWNLYIACYSNYDDSLITLKYNTNGNLLWAKKAKLSGYSDIIPTAMTLDLSGNIYITGEINSYISPWYYSRIFTMKYTSGGNLSFNILYGSGKYNFYSNDVAVDNFGNIFITGSGSGSGYSYDFITLKYNSSGTLQWARREPGNSYDYGKSIMIDSATNNLYITGSINDKINTIKYNSNGAKIWLKEFVQSNIYSSYGIKLLFSNTRQFYVGGFCNTDSGSQNALIKYDSSGTIIWSKLSKGKIKSCNIDYASNIAVSADLYTDANSGWKDYKVIKYDSNGNTLWEKNYDNFTYANDYATSSTIDADNNVYVTGYSNNNNGHEINTLKYSSNGSLVWTNKYSESSTWDIVSRKIKLDNLGNLYLSGTINSKMFIIKYNVNGDTIWTRKFDNGTWNLLVDMQIDYLNNIYLLGYTNGNILLTKYDLDGNLLWSREFNGTTNKNDYPYAMAIDKENNIIITGDTQDNSWYYDCVTIKYSSSGALLWERYFNGSANRNDNANDLAVDDSLNIYVVGSSYSLDKDDDIIIIKYSATGEQLWINRYDNNGYNDNGKNIVIDLSGDIVITGKGSESGYSDYDIVTIKYDKAGLKKWEKIFYLPGNYTGGPSWYNTPIDFVVDKYNNIFVYGRGLRYNLQSGRNFDLIIVKYNEKGVGQWYTSYGGNANRDETGAMICLDSSNNIIIVGTTDDYTTQKNYLTIKYENQITDMSGITGYVFRDKNINGIRDNLENPFLEAYLYLTKDGNWYADTYINEVGEYSFDFIPTGTYLLDIEREEYCGISVPSEPYIIDANNGQLYENFNFGVYFFKDTIKFRTFSPDSLCVVKPIKKKNIATQWSFKVVNSVGITANGLQLQFNGTVTVASYTKFTNIKTSDNKTWVLDGTDIPNGDFIIISGIGPKSGTKVKYQWLKNTSPIGKKFPLYPSTQRYLLPMPNASNVRDYVFAWGGFPEGLVVGVMDDPKEMGWVKLKKSKDLLNSLIDKSGKHTGKPRGFDKFENLKAFRGEQKKLPPKKHNNKLFAEIAALKFNIAASALEVTSNGFGELFYWEKTGNSFVNEGFVQDIAYIADELMTYHWGYDSNIYVDLDSVISKINRAFEGPIDTLRFGTSLKIKGTRILGEIPYLHGDYWWGRKKLEPRIIAPQETPDEYLLYQNYPNPFNPSTTIQFYLPTSSVVTLRIYNVLGQEVATLLDKESLEDGEHQIEFNAYRLASGVYFYRLITKSSTEDDEDIMSKSFVQVKKMLLLK